MKMKEDKNATHALAVTDKKDSPIREKEKQLSIRLTVTQQ